MYANVPLDVISAGGDALGGEVRLSFLHPVLDLSLRAFLLAHDSPRPGCPVASRCASRPSSASTSSHDHTRGSGTHWHVRSTSPQYRRRRAAFRLSLRVPCVGVVQRRAPRGPLPATPRPLALPPPRPPRRQPGHGASGMLASSPYGRRDSARGCFPARAPAGPVPPPHTAPCAPATPPPPVRWHPPPHRSAGRPARDRVCSSHAPPAPCLKRFDPDAPAVAFMGRLVPVLQQRARHL